MENIEKTTVKTPTLEEVKDYFKNAKSVRSHECEPACYYNITTNIHEELYYDEEYKNYAQKTRRYF